jgi:hypothetical protein
MALVPDINRVGSAGCTAELTPENLDEWQERK